MGLLVSVAGLLANELLVPPAGRATKQTEDRIARFLSAHGADVPAPTGGRPLIIPDYSGDQLQRLVVAGAFNFAQKRLDWVNYFQYDRTGRRVILVLEADSAFWDPQKKDMWVFKNARWRWLEDEASAGQPHPQGYRVSGLVPSVEFRLNKTPRQIVAQGKDPEEMSYRELRQYITNLRDQGATMKLLRELEVGLHNKLAIPFTSMVFALIGTPLGLRRLRGGAAVGLGVSILIIFCYYILWHLMSVMGENGQIPPVVACWLANIVGLAVGGVLVVRAAN
jgi:lipopolysaccharide export system permease protein